MACPKSGSGSIAFFAFLRDAIPFTESEFMKFDEVITNIGNQYNPITGVFKAPFAGLYQISCCIMGSVDSAVTYTIHKNDEVFAKGYTSKPDYSSMNQTLLMELEKGDQVYVKHRVPGRREIAEGNRQTYFSGYFIHE